MNDQHNKESERREQMENPMDSMTEGMDFQPAEGSGALRFFITLILGIAIGFGGAWLYFGLGDSGDAAGDAVSGAEAEEENAPAGGNNTAVASVALSDQSAGSQVALAKVVFDRIGWIAIYEDNEGAPGRILGAQIFDKGENAGVVELLRPTEVGMTYYAIMHSDSGDRRFDLADDPQMAGPSGKVVSQTFKAL